METHNLIQGTPEWYAHRAPPLRNASDSPNVMGEGYKSRSDFMREWVTGIKTEYDAATEARFATGHRFEKLALPLMEEIVGQPLYPVTGTEGKYGASFDGLAVGDDIGSEHKQLNDAIRACKTAAALPLLYRIQMEVQCRVSGAGKILFMATDWDENDTLREEVHFWYEPDLTLRAQIDAAWDQFESDAAAYTPPEVIPAAVAAPTLALPAVSIQVSGAVALTSNLGLFLTELQGFIKKLPEKPSTDQEFADCKAACKTLQEAQDALDAAEANAMGQVASFDEMKRAKALCTELARNTRLALEKLVVAREKAIKEEIVAAAKIEFGIYLTRLDTRLGGKRYLPLVPADFAGVIKSKRTITRLRDAVDTELARAKIAANEIADGIDANLKTLRDFNEYHFLFADAAQIVLKPNDDFAILVKSRITEHKEAEAKRLEAETQRIRAEEQAKAEAKVKAEAEAKIRAEHEAQQKAAEAAQVGLNDSAPSNTQGNIMAHPVTSGVNPLPTSAAPQTLVNGNTPAPTGIAKLQLLIAELLVDFTPGELQQVLDAARQIKAARRERATA